MDRHHSGTRSPDQSNTWPAQLVLIDDSNIAPRLPRHPVTKLGEATPHGNAAENDAVIALCRSELACRDDGNKFDNPARGTELESRKSELCWLTLPDVYGIVGPLTIELARKMPILIGYAPIRVL
jgi:hypothetical protein